jgi:alpha-L-fucosidase
LYRSENPESYVTQKLQPDLRDLVTRYKPDDILVDGEWEHNSTFWKTKEFLGASTAVVPVNDHMLTVVFHL